MTKEEAQTRIAEWKAVESTRVWNDFIEGMTVLGKMHRNTLERTDDDRKLYRSQGAMAVIRTVLDARMNQVKEALEIIEGKTRTTDPSARYS
jgi:chaperonin cofactor prefoldin